LPSSPSILTVRFTSVAGAPRGERRLVRSSATCISRISMPATFYERGREGTEKGAPLVGGERKRRRARMARHTRARPAKSPQRASQPVISVDLHYARVRILNNILFRRFLGALLNRSLARSRIYRCAFSEGDLRSFLVLANGTSPWRPVSRFIAIAFQSLTTRSIDRPIETARALCRCPRVRTRARAPEREREREASLLWPRTRHRAVSLLRRWK